jgi:RNA polymerase sigma factor (sigma-70 family)
MSPKVSTRLLAAQSDQRLLELVRHGHERAFEALVQRYRRPLLRYCSRMGMSDSRAEDVLQHALLQAWLALERGTEVRELRPWLYRIVHNTAVNDLRSSREEHGSYLDALEPDAGAESESILERRIAVREALTDVSALPQMQREAILLTAVDGRSHEEVASALGISHGAVRGLLYRARTSLRGAAAALTPQPLISWASGAVGGASPTAQRLAELSAPGGAGSMTSMLLKGAAVAVTVVVAAGAVLAHKPHHHAPHSTTRAATPTLVTASAASAVAPSAVQRPDVHSSAGPVTGHSSAPAPSGSAPLMLARTSPVSHRTAPSPGAGSPQRAVTVTGTSPTPAGSDVGAGKIAAAAPSGEGAGGSSGSGGQSGGGATGTGSSGSSGTEPGGHEDGGAATGEGKAEREAEAAHERQQQEAEAAHERAEREAEIARERKEREAEEAREGKGG